MKWVLIVALRVWRAVVSPLYGPVCRYHPSCSAYALAAVTRFGAVRGTWMAVCRVVRCNPWSHGGYDPVAGTDPEHDAEVSAARGRPEAEVRDDGEHEPGPVVPESVIPPDGQLSTALSAREAHQ